MDKTNDALQGHDIWLKQSKQFFERGLPLLDQFFANRWLDEKSALFELDQMMFYFKAQVKIQQNFFDFLPKIHLNRQSSFPKYFSILSTMTDEAVDLLHSKMSDSIKNNESPQSLRDFYEMWLDCSEGVYQKWLHTDKFLSAFGELVNGMC